MRSASGFIDDQRAEEGMNSYTREFDRQMDERVVKLWREGQFMRRRTSIMSPSPSDAPVGSIVPWP